MWHPGVPLEMTGGFRLVMGVPIGVPQKTLDGSFQGKSQSKNGGIPNSWIVYFMENPSINSING